MRRCTRRQRSRQAASAYGGIVSPQMRCRSLQTRTGWTVTRLAPRSPAGSLIQCVLPVGTLPMGSCWSCPGLVDAKLQGVVRRSQTDTILWTEPRGQGGTIPCAEPLRRTLGRHPCCMPVLPDATPALTTMPAGKRA